MKFHEELIKSLFPRKDIDFSLSTTDLEKGLQAAANLLIAEVKAQIFISTMC